MSEGIRIDHHAVHASAGEMEAQSQQIRRTVEKLMRDLAPVVSTWEGPDQEWYTTHTVPSWNDSLTQLDAQLVRLIETLRQNSHNLSQTAARNTENFQAIRF